MWYNIITIFLIILGWLVIYLLNLKQQKKQLVDSAKLKIYEELYNLKKEIDKKVMGLSSLCSRSRYTLFTDIEYANKGIGIKKPFEIWQKYVSDLSRAIFSFTDAYLDFWTGVETWIEVMPELKKAKNELFNNQFNRLTDDLNKYHQYLQFLPMKINSRWDKLNEKEIKERAEQIGGRIDRIACGYVDDFIGLIHNALIASIFGRERRPRENFANMPQEYAILTRDGIKDTVLKK